MRATTHALRWTENPPPTPPVQYVSLLGHGEDQQNAMASVSIAVASVTITAADSLFLGMAANLSQQTGFVCNDNLGNTYTVESGPELNSGLVVILWGCLNPTPGVLTSMTVSWGGGMTDGAIAIRAARFKNIGSREPMTLEHRQGPSWTTDNYVLKQAGDPDGLGINVWGCRTHGADGSDPYAGTGGVFLGTNDSPSNIPVGNSNHATIWMGYAKPVLAVGIGHDHLTFTGNQWASVGKAYKP